MESSASKALGRSELMTEPANTSLRMTLRSTHHGHYWVPDAAGEPWLQAAREATAYTATATQTRGWGQRLPAENASGAEGPLTPIRPGEFSESSLNSGKLIHMPSGGPAKYVPVSFPGSEEQRHCTGWRVNTPAQHSGSATAAQIMC